MLQQRRFFGSFIILACVLILSECIPCQAFAEAQIGLNFAGARLFSDNTGYYTPPDTMGAVGEDHVAQLLNGVYRVYDKSDGTQILTTSLDDFWTNAGVTFAGSNTFDPRITYDPSGGRYFAASVDNSKAANNLLVAVSNSGNPLDGWTGFAVDSDPTDTRWADYPMLGYNGEVVTISANMFPISSGGIEATVLTIPKADLLAPTPTIANATLFENVIASTGFSPHPIVDPSGGALPTTMLSADNAVVRSSQLSGTPYAPLLSGYVSSALTYYPDAPNANQPGTKQNLDNLDPRLNSPATLSGDAFYAVQCVKGPNNLSALRWFIMDATDNSILGQGLVTDDELDLYYPSIAVNESGDVVIGCSGSSKTQFVSAYAVVGKSDGATIVFEDDLLLLKAGVDDYELVKGGRNRWGDYSSTVVDPSDPSVFWTIQEWADFDTIHPDKNIPIDRWATQVTQIIVPEPSSLLLVIMGLLALALIRKK